MKVIPAGVRDDELIQVWVVHHIGIIGEAASKISEEMRKSFPHIPWTAIKGMRNILVHQYFGIDLDEVWNTTQRYLPALKNQISEILNRKS